MPIYEYRCDKGHTFEVMQSMSAEPLSACEVCGAPVQKVLHAPAVHFKGSGFYTTDYGKKKAAGAGADSKKSDSNGSAGSSDAGSASSSDSGSSKSDAGKKSESKTGSSKSD
ncbi:MAG TPA: zinc ribbon domain-containing protein [Thermoleophilaceae bacterium]|nr:zinc ribbon domain-containing protein [Thermoleophilaceae bacterium]